MTLAQPKKNKSFDPVPAGNHVARLYEIIHIGTIPTEWKGEQKMTDKIRLTFELCNEKKEFKEGEGPKPFSISREFTYSFGNKSALRPFIDGLTGSKMTDDEHPDLEALLGEACLLNVVHTEKDGNTYANIQNASPLPKGMTAPVQANPSRILDVVDMKLEDIQALPEFLQKKIYQSEEYAERIANAGNKVKDFRPKVVEEVSDDEIPF